MMALCWAISLAVFLALTLSGLVVTFSEIPRQMNYPGMAMMAMMLIGPCYWLVS